MPLQESHFCASWSNAVPKLLSHFGTTSLIAFWYCLIIAILATINSINAVFVMMMMIGIVTAYSNRGGRTCRLRNSRTGRKTRGNSALLSAP